MPVLFIGHGSPMNALASNEYTQTLNRLGATLPKPKAIVMISAHWLTKGTWVTARPKPKTIHDFGGFPQALFDVQYPAPGEPKLSQKIINSITDLNIGADINEWGLDHGAWSILCHLYPKADVPVVQLSMDMTKSASFHYELGQKISFLRDEGVLIIASGNVVHNLRRLDWNEKAPAHSWALDFEQWMKEKIENHDHQSLIQDFLKSQSGELSNPTPDHYYPLLYALGATEKSDRTKLLYREIQNASISMLSYQWG